MSPTLEEERAAWEPSFVAFNRNVKPEESYVTCGKHGFRGSGSTDAYDFIKAYDEAIEAAEKRGAAMSTPPVQKPSYHPTIKLVDAETKEVFRTYSTATWHDVNSIADEFDVPGAWVYDVVMKAEVSESGYREVHITVTRPR